MGIVARDFSEAVGSPQEVFKQDAWHLDKISVHPVWQKRWKSQKGDNTYRPVKEGNSNLLWTMKTRKLCHGKQVVKAVTDFVKQRPYLIGTQQRWLPINGLGLVHDQHSAWVCSTTISSLKALADGLVQCYFEETWVSYTFWRLKWPECVYLPCLG